MAAVGCRGPRPHERLHGVAKRGNLASKPLGFDEEELDG
jgi:hypothetical protein